MGEKKEPGLFYLIMVIIFSVVGYLILYFILLYYEVGDAWGATSHFPDSIYSLKEILVVLFLALTSYWASRKLLRHRLRNFLIIFFTTLILLFGLMFLMSKL